MVSKHINLVVLLLLATVILNAEQITISGQYVDKKNNPIAGAPVEYFANIVQLDSTGTDDDGYFTLQINTVGIETETIPDHFHLGQNYPNPFNPETRIPVSTPYPATLSLFNICGQLVDKIDIPSGRYDIIWGGLDKNGKPVSSGIYLMLLEGNNVRLSKRMALLDGGRQSGLRIENYQSSGQRSGLAKTSTLDEIHFIKPNTTTRIIQLKTITQDTSLGVITGNVGPTILQTIPYDSCGQVEYLTWDLDQLIYNDGDSRYFLKDTAEFEFHPLYPNILEFLAYPLGIFSTTLYIEDITDPFLKDSMQLKYKTFYVPPPWTLLHQIADIPDTLIYYGDTLVMDMQHYVLDDDLDIIGYGIDTLPYATYYFICDSLWIIPEQGYYGTMDSIVIWVEDSYYSDTVFLNPFSLTVNAPPWTLPYQIINIPDTTISSNDTLKLDMLQFVAFSKPYDITYYGIDSLSHATYQVEMNDIWIIPDLGFYGIIENIIIWVRVKSNVIRVYLEPFNLTITEPP